MQESTWLEVSLLVDGEMAEAVSEVLARFVSSGVVIESTTILADAEDEGQAVGPLRVCGYLPVDVVLERKRQDLEEALWHLGRIRPLPEAHYQPIQEADWAEAWKQHYNPVKIGKRLLVLPAWLETTDPERIPVRIDPGMAFGTGTHPTTQLCLELLDKRIDQGRTQAVIDIGCGSGILAVAALQLGVQRALAVDLDLQAIEATRQNATVNEVFDRLEVGLGSVAEIRTGAFSIRSAPIVVANILAPVIVRLFGDGLADLLTSEGVLICSGILADQSREVETAARLHGLQSVDRRQEEDWVALVYIKRSDGESDNWG